MPSTGPLKTLKPELNTSQEVHQAHWQLNDPIDVDNYEPMSKQEALPIITKVESICQAKIPVPVDIKNAKNAYTHVCNLFGLDSTKTLEDNREELRKNNVGCTYKLDLESDVVKACKSIFIPQLPQWFENFHVKYLIQLKSEINVPCEDIYMFKGHQNRNTGECLLRFTENKDCLQVYKDLQGTHLLDWPLNATLDLGNEIAEMRDNRKNTNLEEMFRKYTESGTELSSEQMLEGGNAIQIKNEQDCSDEEVQFIDPHSTKKEIERTIGPKTSNHIEVNHETDDTGNDRNMEEANSHNSMETASNDSAQDSTKERIIYDHHFLNSKIVHVSNLDPEKFNSELIRSLIKSEYKYVLPPYTYRRVKSDSVNQRATGDVLLEFQRHRVARQMAKVLDGKVDHGRTIRAVVGAGYKMLPEVTLFDLEMFKKTVDKKRKLEQGDKIDEQAPAKKTRTENSSTSLPSPSDDNLMTPDERCFEAYGLTKDFIVKHKLKVPFSRTVVVTRLHKRVDEAKLIEVFSLAGDVKKVKVSEDRDYRRYNKAVIDFDHPLEAVQAISMLHGQKLYDVDMDIKMEEVTWKVPKSLPSGLSAVGPGLADNGGPMRGLRNHADLRLLHEMFTDVGLMERVSNTSKPFKFNYKKLKPKDRTYPWAPRDTNAKEPSAASSSGKVNSSTSKSSADSSTSKDDKKTQEKEAPESTLLAIQALGTVLVAQGLIPSSTDCQSLQSILSALQKNAVPPQNKELANQMPSTQVPNQANPSTSGNTNQNIALTDAVNKVMQFMPHNIQNPNVPAQMVQMPQRSPSGFIPPPGGYQNPRLPMQPITSMLPNPRIPQPGPRITIVPPYINRLPQPHLYPQTRPVFQNYDQTQKSTRSNLVLLSNQPQQQLPHTAPTVHPYSRDNPENHQSYRKSDMLVFKNLPACVNAEVLQSKMREVGELKFCEMTGVGRAFVRFHELADAERCIRLFHRSKVDGQVIEVGFL